MIIRRGNQHANLVESDDHSKISKFEGYKDHFYYSALVGSLTNDNNIWPIYSGASGHMTGDPHYLTSLVEKILAQKVEIPDHNNYAVKGKTSIDLETSENVHFRNILYVSGLKIIWFQFHV